MLNTDELSEILDKLYEMITLANRNDTLDALLSKWGLTELSTRKSSYKTKHDGKIVVIGGSEVNKDILLGIVKNLGLDKDRFEFCLDYNSTKTYKYSKLHFNPDYRLVLFGPVPHSSIGKNDSSSVIAEMQTHEGYPKVEILGVNKSMRISKTNFKIALKKYIDEGFI